MIEKTITGFSRFHLDSSNASILLSDVVAISVDNTRVIELLNGSEGIEVIALGSMDNIKLSFSKEPDERIIEKKQVAISPFRLSGLVAISTKQSGDDVLLGILLFSNARVAEIAIVFETDEIELISDSQLSSRLYNWTYDYGNISHRWFPN